MKHHLLRTLLYGLGTGTGLVLSMILGFRQFSLRGLAATAGEWCLVCLAFNLKRMHILYQEQGLL